MDVTPADDPYKEGKIVDESGAVRIDYIYSYWILLWFFVYVGVARNVKKGKKVDKFTDAFYKYGNPLYTFYFALIENLFNFLLICFYIPEMIGQFIFMIFLLKFLPIYFLLYFPTNVYYNFIYSFAFFVIYNIYLGLVGTNVFEVYKKTIYFLINGENKTPLYQLIHYFSTELQKK